MKTIMVTWLLWTLCYCCHCGTACCMTAEVSNTAGLKRCLWGKPVHSSFLELLQVRMGDGSRDANLCDYCRRPFYRRHLLVTQKTASQHLRYTHKQAHTTILWPLGFCPGLPGWAGTRKVQPIWIYWIEIVNDSGISWAICKSAPWPRHKTMPASHHSVFYRPDVLPAAQPTASKHWRHKGGM